MTLTTDHSRSAHRSVTRRLTAASAARPTGPAQPADSASTLFPHPTPVRRAAPLPRTWVDAASCRDDDPDLYDPVNRFAARRATAVCQSCPVRRECLLEALVEETDAADGPWLVRGGLSPAERRNLTRSERDGLITDLADSIHRTRPPQTA